MAKKKIKSILKSKTVWTSLACIATGVGMYVTGEQSLEELMVSVMGAVFVVLRLVTSEPVSLS